MTVEKKLSENFCCAKCRNKAGIVRTVWLTNSLLSLLSYGAGGKYYLITCGLCGFTEMYDARVYALQFEASPNEAPLPQKP